MSLIWPATFTVFAVTVLISLGVWQLHRSVWKQKLIAEIESRAHTTPRPLPEIEDWPKLRPYDYEYRHVEATGVFDHAKEALVLRAGKEPGYHVLTPLHLKSGGYVVVNRGFVPLSREKPAARPAGQIQGEAAVTGLMRQPEARNPFTPIDNPAAGRFFTSDPELIARHFGLMPAAPFTIDADPVPLPGGWPRGGTAVLVLPNNHFDYALTWFSLALAATGVFAVIAWQNRRDAAYRRK
ncbi:MAG: SURF1 family protein [Beijerinckiaceae bacterium]|nr:SURF1 family protein [Beijerinckiaceae bacterium]MCI0737178.1 SURF1 family protein [Beijerinckiaceae bacterium]